jgi:hypothetical protein
MRAIFFLSNLTAPRSNDKVPRSNDKKKLARLSLTNWNKKEI